MIFSFHFHSRVGFKTLMNKRKADLANYILRLYDEVDRLQASSMQDAWTIEIRYGTTIAVRYTKNMVSSFHNEPFRQQVHADLSKRGLRVIDGATSFVNGAFVYQATCEPKS